MHLIQTHPSPLTFNKFPINESIENRSKSIGIYYMIEELSNRCYFPMSFMPNPCSAKVAET